MLNTLMDISEAESGAMPLRRETLPLGEVVERAIDLYRDVAESKGVSLTMRRQSRRRSSSGDRVRLEQVAANLLDNAIKYTPPGGRVTASVGSADGRVALRRGRHRRRAFRADELPRIWERLFRGDRSRTERGLGLGLSLVKAIVEAHGGSRRCTSASPAAAAGLRSPLPDPLAPESRVPSPGARSFHRCNAPVTSPTEGVPSNRARKAAQRGRPMKRGSIFSAIALAAAVTTGAVWQGKAADAAETAGQSVTATAPARISSGGRDSYADVVKVVTPAVVTIRTEGRATRVPDAVPGRRSSAPFLRRSIWKWPAAHAGPAQPRARVRRRREQRRLSADQPSRDRQRDRHPGRIRRRPHFHREADRIGSAERSRAAEDRSREPAPAHARRLGRGAGG